MCWSLALVNHERYLPHTCYFESHWMENNTNHGTGIHELALLHIVVNNSCACDFFKVDSNGKALCMPKMQKKNYAGINL